MVSFDDVLIRPLPEFAVPESKARDLVQQQVRRLRRFTGTGIPPDLRDSFGLATGLTTASHETCETILALATATGDLHRLSTPQILRIAAKHLAVSDAAGSASPQAKSSMHEVREQLWIAFAEAMEDPSRAEETWQETIEKRFRGAPLSKSVSAYTTGKLMWAQHDVITYALSNLLAASQIALIWRGIFYIAVVQEHGASIETEAARRRAFALSGELGLLLVAKIPVFGDVLELGSILCKLAQALIDKGALLDNMIAELAATYQPAREYIDLYCKALNMWAAKAIEIQQCVLDFENDLHPLLNPGAPNA